jgi:hypothetical protein
MCMSSGGTTAGAISSPRIAANLRSERLLTFALPTHTRREKQSIHSILQRLVIISHSHYLLNGLYTLL